jgi:hypothetical protein
MISGEESEFSNAHGEVVEEFILKLSAHTSDDAH